MRSLKRRITRTILEHYYARAIEKDRLGVLLVLGHMRSGSSLLAHVLNTNPQIIGYGETHQRYRTERDLGTLAYRVYRSFGVRRISHRYVMDKVLHDQFLKDPRLLKCWQVRSVFLLRRPAESVGSIMRLQLGRGSRENAAPHGSTAIRDDTLVTLDAEASVDYYLTRLGTLVRYAEIIGRKDAAFVLTYEQLTQATSRALEGLRGFLRLEHPLTDRYSTHWATGVRGRGDPSEAIWAGRIVPPGTRQTPELPPVALARAERVYSETCASLRQLCSHVES